MKSAYNPNCTTYLSPAGLRVEEVTQGYRSLRRKHCLEDVDGERRQITRNKPNSPDCGRMSQQSIAHPGTCGRAAGYLQSDSPTYYFSELVGNTKESEDKYRLY